MRSAANVAVLVALLVPRTLLAEPASPPVTLMEVNIGMPLSPAGPALERAIQELPGAQYLKKSYSEDIRTAEVTSWDVLPPTTFVVTISADGVSDDISYEILISAGPDPDTSKPAVTALAILLDNVDLTYVEQQLIAKWGEPTRGKAIACEERLTWRRANSILTMCRYSHDATGSLSLRLEDPAFMARATDELRRIEAARPKL